MVRIAMKGETAQAIELRQSGENSILGNIAVNVSASLTQVLRWAHWWNSTEESPDDVTTEQVLVELNTDFSTKGLGPQEIQAIVARGRRMPSAGKRCSTCSGAVRCCRRGGRMRRN